MSTQKSNKLETKINSYDKKQNYEQTHNPENISV